MKDTQRERTQNSIAIQYNRAALCQISAQREIDRLNRQLNAINIKRMHQKPFCHFKTTRDTASDALSISISIYLSRAPFGFVSFVFFWFGKCVKCVLYRVMLCFWWDLSHHRKPHYGTEFQCCRLISLPFSFAVRSRFNRDHNHFFSLSGYIFPHIKHTIAHSYSCENKKMKMK